VQKYPPAGGERRCKKMIKNTVERGTLGQLVDHAKRVNLDVIVFSKEEMEEAHKILRFANPEDPRMSFSEKLMAAYRDLPAPTKSEMRYGAEIVLHPLSGNVGVRRNFDSLQRLVTTTSP
jgi:hypothetical protein